MDEQPSRRLLIVAAAILIGGTIFASAALLGGQTSKILSTVGNSVGPIDGGSGAGAGADSGSGSGSDAGAGSGSGGVDPAGAGATANPGNGGQIANAAATIPTLLIVRTGELEITVADLGTALGSGESTVVASGGYVSGSSRTASSGRDTALVTYRIPSSAWERTLAALRALASTVDREDVKTDEVSGQVVDLTARIANLRATESALQAIMAKAAKISDVLDVQRGLTTTRGDIEKLVGEKARLEDQASFGSLAVTFRLPVAPSPIATPTPAKGWDPADDVARASGKLVAIGQTTTSVGIWLAIVGLPIAIAGLLVTLAGWQVYRLARWLVRRREAVGAGS